MISSCISSKCNWRILNCIKLCHIYCIIWIYSCSKVTYSFSTCIDSVRIHARSVVGNAYAVYNNISLSSYCIFVSTSSICRYCNINIISCYNCSFLICSTVYCRYCIVDIILSCSTDITCSNCSIRIQYSVSTN